MMKFKDVEAKVAEFKAEHLVEIEVLHQYHQPDWAAKNMIVALNMMPAMNDKNDWARLAAAMIVKKERAALR